MMNLSKKNRRKVTIDKFDISLISNKKLDKDNLKKLIDLVSNYSSQSEFISISQDSNNTTINLLSKFENFNNINLLKAAINQKFPNLDFVFVRDSTIAI